MISMIWTDLGKVLVDFQDRCQVVDRIVHQFGGRTGAMQKMFGNGDEESDYQDLDLGVVSFGELWEKILQQSKIFPESLPLERFAPLYVESIRPYVDALEVFRLLQERYHIILVSDCDFGGVYASDMLQAHYRLRFSKIFLSCQEKQKKPQLLKRVATWAREQGVDPSLCVFIDDNIKYVEAARKEGAKAVLHSSSKECVADLLSKLHEVGVTIRT